MQKNNFWIYHFLIWFGCLIYVSANDFLFPSTPLERHFSFHLLLLHANYILCLMAVFYYVLSVILPGLARKKNMALYIAGAILAFFIFPIFRYILEEVIDPNVFGFRNYGTGTTYAYYLFDNFYRGLPAIFLAVTAWSLKRSYVGEQQIKQLREEKTNAELAFLKSQVNPHFLYNTLNYMYSLALPVSDKLSNATIKLSKMMRYLLHESSAGMIEISKEIDYLNSYIALYQLRFKDKFYVDFKINVPDTSKQVATLILIPFVENAFKHGVVDDAENPVIIDLSIVNNKLSLTVINKINHNQKDASSGIGLNNIRRRLELIYPENFEMLIFEDERKYKTTLNIKL